MTKIDTSNSPIRAVLHDTRINKDLKEKQALGATKEADKAASGFEALLLHNMLKEMWGTANIGGGKGILDENSNEMQIFKDMFNQAIADEVVKGEGLGVKKFLKKELSNYQKSASKLVLEDS